MQLNMTYYILNTAQRITPVVSKLSACKLGQNRASSNWIGDQTIAQKRRVSLEAKSQPFTPTNQQQHINVSLLKCPTSTSRLNPGMIAKTSSKFGYSATKK